MLLEEGESELPNWNKKKKKAQTSTNIIDTHV